MPRTLILLVVISFLRPAHAERIDFQISADDYAELSIDGKSVALVDSIPGGTDHGSVDLIPGLHDIQIDFENRLGSSWLSFSWKTATKNSFDLVPKNHMYSIDVDGNKIEGLRADYSTGLTVYGEGPISHNWNNTYENRSGTAWAGFVDISTLFAETLSGQILIVLNGDFDKDGDLNVLDINALTNQIVEGTNQAQFDLDGDGSVGEMDLDIWIHELKNTWYGDANLDGQFNSQDLVMVFQQGHYGETIIENVGWADGDWNADGRFDSRDLVIAFQDGGYEKGRSNPAMAVPETNYIAFFFPCGIGMLQRLRGKRHG